MSVESEPGKIKRETLNAVVKIEVPTGKTGRQPNGTGFLISKSENGQIFLVTNKHVVGDWNSMDGDIKVYNPKLDLFVYKKPASGGGHTKVSISLVDASGGVSNKLKIHKDPLVDIAIVDVTTELKSNNEIFLTRFDVSYLVPFDKIYSGQNYGIGDDVFALGYPYGITSTLDNLPIAKSVRIASLPGVNFSVDFPAQNRAGTQKEVTIKGKLIVADGLIVGGNSGGPVVLPVGVRFRFTKEKGIQFTKNDEQNLVIGIVSSSLGQSGINIIYSADYISELLGEWN